MPFAMSLEAALCSRIDDEMSLTTATTRIAPSRMLMIDWPVSFGQIDALVCLRDARLHAGDELRVPFWILPTMPAISVVERLVRSASLRTSSATTANRRPCSPARAAYRSPFEREQVSSGRRFSRMVLTIEVIWSDCCPSSSMIFDEDCRPREMLCISGPRSDDRRARARIPSAASCEMQCLVGVVRDLIDAGPSFPQPRPPSPTPTRSAGANASRLLRRRSAVRRPRIPSRPRSADDLADHLAQRVLHLLPASRLSLSPGAHVTSVDRLPAAMRRVISFA